MEILTERLRLIPLTLDQLQCYVAAPENLEQELGLKVSRDIVTDRLCRAIAMKVSKMGRADPSKHCWYTYWLIVVKDRQYGAGLAGFKGVPDDQGKTEIGYGIDTVFRNRGYMTEAVRGLVEWAFTDARCKTIIAPNTEKRNVASNRVLEKAGMQIYNETKDAFDWMIDRKNWRNAVISAGISMAARNFECILCLRHFSRMTADAVMPDEMVCNDCLSELCQLDEDHLNRRVSEQLTRRAIQDKELEKRIIEFIHKYNQ